MPAVGPISRTDLVAALARAGFTGPVGRGPHQAMKRGTRRVSIPNAHGGDISTGLLKRVLRQAGISREEWERL